MQVVSTEEAVIVVLKEGKPFMMVRKNGAIEYFLLKRASWQDHLELLATNVIKE